VPGEAEDPLSAGGDDLGGCGVVTPMWAWPNSSLITTSSAPCSRSSAKKASVSTSDFVAALRGAGAVFFAKMADLFPENADSYSESRREFLSELTRC
jgi:hypothetical protein